MSLPGDGKALVDERELVSRAASGDAASVRALYDSQVQYLSAVCRRYITDEEEVKDVLQDSFVKIFSSLRKFVWRGEGSLRAWMKRIVVNEALMILRRRSRLDMVSATDSLPESADEDTPDTDGIPMPVLQKMIRELPDGYRTVFNLYAIEGMSHKDIAALLGISESASCSQFSRARARLAAKIREFRNGR